MPESQESPPIWPSFCKALGAEPREHKEIQGSSGLTHQVQAIAVDDKTSRIILVSAEYNPRIAALMRIDVQAMYRGAKVLVARPIAVDLAHTAKSLFGNESGGINFAKIMELSSILAVGGDAAQELLKARYGPKFGEIFASIGRSKLPIRSHILNAIEQAAALNWENLRGNQYKEALPIIVDVLGQFMQSDNLAGDRKEGICPVPTYELTESDWELFASGRRIDEVRERLKALDIYDYFFPPADNLALGLIEKGLSTEGQIQKGLDIAERDGHQISPNAIVSTTDSVQELLDAIKERGLIVEGEFENELTVEGKTVRQKLKFRPPEGLIERLSKIVSIKVDLSLKDIFGKGS